MAHHETTEEEEPEIEIEMDFIEELKKEEEVKEVTVKPEYPDL